MKRNASACAALMLLGQVTAAADPPPRPAHADPRVAAQLKALKYAYEITADQDYKLVFEVGDEHRTQAVVVNSNTEFYDRFEIREVWSPALTVQEPIDPALASRLLRANNTVKIGAWRIWPAAKKEGPEELYVVFAAQIDARAPKETLAATLDMVAQTADLLEKELTGKDDH
jgi:hypothetical protein